MLLDAPPWPIGTLIDAVGRASPEALAEALGGWVLVGSDFSGEDDQWNFRTLSVRTVRDQTESGEMLLLRDNFIVLPLRKAGRSFQDTILVGRASSNDVCVRHLSVSKLHARIRRREDGLEISDAGSSNGTRVRGAATRPDEWVAVASGDLVCFGSCPFHALEPTHLGRLLQRFGPSPGP